RSGVLEPEADRVGAGGNRHRGGGGRAGRVGVEGTARRRGGERYRGRRGHVRGVVEGVLGLQAGHRRARAGGDGLRRGDEGELCRRGGVDGLCLGRAGEAGGRGGERGRAAPGVFEIEVRAVGPGRDRRAGDGGGAGGVGVEAAAQGGGRQR